MKNPKGRLTRTSEGRRVIGFHELVSASLIFNPLISTDWYWSFGINWAEAPGKLFCASISSRFLTFSLIVQSVERSTSADLPFASGEDFCFLFCSVWRDGKIARTWKKMCFWSMWMAGTMTMSTTLLSFGVKEYTDDYSKSPIADIGGAFLAIHFALPLFQTWCQSTKPVTFLVYWNSSILLISLDDFQLCK